MASVSTAPTNSNPTGVGARSPSKGAMTNGDDNGIRSLGGSMHPAPSLIEAPPTKNHRPDRPRSGQHALHVLSAGTQSPGQGSNNNALFTTYTPYAPEHVPVRDLSRQSRSPSPLLRKDTHLSTSTTATNATNNSLTSATTAATPPSAASSPPAIPGQSLFSINNSDVGQGRRPNRRRTGPLNPEQREKAAIIRKMGACVDCRRRRVGCQPQHHSMTWDDAYERFGPNNSPGRQEPTSLSPVRGSLLSNAGYKRFSQDMEDDTPIPAHSEQPPLKVRKPLPSGPRPLERTAQAALSLSPDIPGDSNVPGSSTGSPGPSDARNSNLPPSLMSGNPSGRSNPNFPAPLTSRNFSGLELHRYIAVHALLLYWEDESFDEVKRATEDLRVVFQHDYNYKCEVELIPHSPEPSASSRWLSGRIDRFNQLQNLPNALKIVYYNGRSYMDRDREMVLANSLSTERRCEVKWKGIQAKLEETVADTLIIMDCPYLGPRASSRDNVMTVLANCDFSDYGSHPVPRCLFTRRVVENLRKYARQTFRGPCYTTNLAADILTDYLHHIPDARTDQEILTKFPQPLHQTLSGDANIPIMLAPAPQGGPPAPVLGGHGRSMRVRIDCDAAAEGISMDDMIKWIRRLPGAIRNVQVDYLDA